MLRRWRCVDVGAASFALYTLSMEATEMEAAQERVRQRGSERAVSERTAIALLHVRFKRDYKRV